jgi:hypothetical protein
MTMRACLSSEAKFPTEPTLVDPFASSRARLEEMVVKLEGPDFRDATHSALQTSCEPREASA